MSFIEILILYTTGATVLALVLGIFLLYNARTIRRERIRRDHRKTGELSDRGRGDPPAPPPDPGDHPPALPRR